MEDKIDTNTPYQRKLLFDQRFHPAVEYGNFFNIDIRAQALKIQVWYYLN